MQLRSADSVGDPLLRQLRSPDRRHPGRQLLGLRSRHPRGRALLRQLRPRGRDGHRACGGLAAVPDCPTCGASTEPGQEYCLECGARLPSSGGIVAGIGRAWRRRLRWYPGDWLPVVLALLVVAALATAAAVYAGRDEQETVAGTTLVATSPPDVTEPRTQSTRTETAPVASVPTDVTRTAPPADGAGPGNPVEWPADEDGFTVVLASLP